MILYESLLTIMCVRNWIIPSWASEMDVPYKLYKGDCLEIMPTLEAGSIDAIITDLPYGTTACAWDEVIPFADMWKEVKRVLKSNGAFITTASQPFTSKIILSDVYFFRYEWIWSKNKGSNFTSLDYQPNKTHEHILVFGSGRLTYNPQMQRTESAEVIRRARAVGRSSIIRASKSKPSEHKPDMKKIDGIFTEYVNPKSVQAFDSVPNQHVKHPTQKPVALYEYLINTYTNFGETVLDITMGSGTTIIAAMKTGRKSIGIERDPKYFAIAEKRIRQAAQQPALFHEAQQSVQRTGGESAANLSLFPAEANPPAKVTR